jgi:hypothetical protein
MALLGLGSALGEASGRPDDMNALVAYLLAAMLAWSPPADHEYYEPREETVARYVTIARTIAEVALDPAEPPLFGGPDGRAETALFIASVAFYESGGFRRDVELGTGKRARGDAGRSWCLMQVNIGGGVTEDRWTGPDLVNDQDKCIRAGLHRMRESFRHCSGQTFIDRLSGYTDGRCRDGANAAHRRTKRAVEFWEQHPPRPIERPPTQLTAQLP